MWSVKPVHEIVVPGTKPVKVDHPARLITGNRQGDLNHFVLEPFDRTGRQLPVKTYSLLGQPQYIPTSIASRFNTDSASLVDLGGNSFNFSKSRIIGGSLGIGGIPLLSRLRDI